MGVRNRGNGQFRFDAHRVEARGVENGKAGFQQRVRVIDHRVTPGRDFDAVLVFHHVAQVGVVLIPQPQRARFHLEYDLGFGQFAHRGDHGARVGDFELDGAPLDRVAFQCGDAVVAEAGFNRQQANVGFGVRVVINFGRAHRGAAGVGRQQPLLEIGEEQGVDQFGFTATELSHECDHQAVPLQVLGQIEQAQHLFRLGIGVVLQPLLVGRDYLHQPVTPIFEPGDAAFQTIIHPIFPINRRIASSDSIATHTDFRRDFSPRTILTALRGTPRHVATNSTKAAFAAPSTGRALMRILMASPCSPAISLFDAPG